MRSVIICKEFQGSIAKLSPSLHTIEPGSQTSGKANQLLTLRKKGL